MVVRFYVKSMLITSVHFVRKLKVLYDSEVTAMCSLATYGKLRLMEHLLFGYMLDPVINCTHPDFQWIYCNAFRSSVGHINKFCNICRLHYERLL